MKKIHILLLVLFSFASGLTAFGQNKVDIFGYYSIEKAPKDFADISYIHLAGDYGAQQKPPFYGLIRLTNIKTKDFRLLKPTLKGKNLTFSTGSLNGISYKFSGTFTRLGDFPELQANGEVLLTGVLIKYRGRQKVASADLKFSYEAGG